MSIAEDLMRFRESLSTGDQDIALIIKMAAAVIEQMEEPNQTATDRSITFTVEEFMRLPWHWELDEGVLGFRCKRWQEKNEQNYPETGGYPPVS